MPTDAADAFQSVAGIVRFLILFVPGVVAVSVFDIRVPGERRKFSDLGVALVAYSILIDFAAFIALSIHPIHFCSPLLADKTVVPCDAWPPVLFLLIFAVVVPMGIGWFAVDLQRWLFDLGFALSPMPTAWDELFSRLVGLDRKVVMVLTLQNGRKVGGIWGGDGFASTYPADGDLLIAEPCVLNQINGRIVERVAGARALLVKRSDVLTIEIFDHDGMVEWSRTRRAHRAA